MIVIEWYYSRELAFECGIHMLIRINIIVIEK